jgi:hypothetical protein
MPVHDSVLDVTVNIQFVWSSKNPIDSENIMTSLSTYYSRLIHSGQWSSDQKGYGRLINYSWVLYAYVRYDYFIYPLFNPLA